MHAKRTLTDQLIGRQILLLALLVFFIAVSQYVILRAVLLSTEARSLHQEIAVLAPIIHHQLISHGQPKFQSLASI
ncbi:MAG: sensor histidine kinase, partial [Sulfobacillus sp.]